MQVDFEISLRARPPGGVFWCVRHSNDLQEDASYPATVLFHVCRISQRRARHKENRARRRSSPTQTHPTPSQRNTILTQRISRPLPILIVNPCTIEFYKAFNGVEKQVNRKDISYLLDHNAYMKRDSCFHNGERSHT